MGTTAECETWEPECVLAVGKPGETIRVVITARDEYSHEVRSKPETLSVEPVVRGIAALSPINEASDVVPHGLEIAWKAMSTNQTALFKVELQKAGSEWRTICTTTQTTCRIPNSLANGADYVWRVTALSELTGGSPVQSAPQTFQTRLPVVLIHGWGSKAAEMQTFTSRLQEDGYDAIVVDYMPNDDFEGIPVMAASVQRQMVLQLNARGYGERTPIHIVAHSMGGLVSRVLLEHPSEGTASYYGSWDNSSGDKIDPRWSTTVRTLTTIGTPHQGTGLVARGCLGVDIALTSLLSSGVKPWFGQTCADMIPGSAFLERMRPPSSTTQSYYAVVGVGSDSCRLLSCILSQSDGVVPARSAAALGLGVSVTGTCHTETALTRLICSGTPQLRDDAVYRSIQSTLAEADAA
jgi:pimeloyl-ACP methyl ester carboxylesterase